MFTSTICSHLQYLHIYNIYAGDLERADRRGHLLRGGRLPAVLPHHEGAGQDQGRQRGDVDHVLRPQIHQVGTAP